MKTKLNNIMIIVTILFLAMVTHKSIATEFDVQKHLNKSYIKIGFGYKLKETTLYFTDDNGNINKFNDKLSTQIELGYEVTKSFIVGYRHRSQLLSGWPLNDKHEYFVDELFIDYKFSLGDL